MIEMYKNTKYKSVIGPLRFETNFLDPDNKEIGSRSLFTQRENILGCQVGGFEQYMERYTAVKRKLDWTNQMERNKILYR